MNGTQNAPTGAQQFKPGDRAMRGSLEVSVVAVDGDAAWVRYEDGSHATITFRDLAPIPAHPIPSEPNTAWVDKDGEFWFVDRFGTLRFKDGKPAEWATAHAPFARLVPEGSEREAAIGEVVDYLMRRPVDEVSGVGIDRLQRHFLSGVDQ